MALDFIRLKGVRQNNLKNISVDIPLGQLTVITGVSGSGKSSLAFDTLYAEGQRRYVDSLSTYTRQFLKQLPKPDVDSLQNIPPAIALEQRNSVQNARSTVATQTELLDYLRILYSRLGTTYCLTPACADRHIKVERQTPEKVLETIVEKYSGKRLLLTVRLPAPPKGKTKADEMLRAYREQGYQRVLFDDEVLSLDDLESGDFPKIKAEDFTSGRLQLIIDRLKLDAENTASIDEETKTRILGSVEQGYSLGEGEIEIVTLDPVTRRRASIRHRCPECFVEYPTPNPNFFSFNSPMGACPECTGFGFKLSVDERKVVPDPTLTLKEGAVDPLTKPSFADENQEFKRFLSRHSLSPNKRYQDLGGAEKKLIWDGDPKDPVFPGIRGFFKSLESYRYKMHIRIFIRRYQSQTLCPTCLGTRLHPQTQAVRFGDKTLSSVLAMTVTEACVFFKGIQLTENVTTAAKEILFQVRRRIDFLDRIGVGYLSLSRLTKTLSGGEYQRINLATQLGNGLCGTLYVLDEPSIGLHAKDTHRMIGIIEELRDQGNTLVIVEHDLDIIRKADHLIEIGPKAGRDGGNLMIEGTQADLINLKTSVTGPYLAGKRLDLTTGSRPPPARFMTLTGCHENNLKDITVKIPLDRMITICGVSGSGKSTLIHAILGEALKRRFDQDDTPEEGRAEEDDAGTIPLPGVRKIEGLDQIQGYSLLNQKPIGKSSRSNPGTYMKAWDEIRHLFSEEALSLKRGYTARHFSFNGDAGRCPVCEGEGEVSLDMHFLSEVKLPCEGCEGKRFKSEILEVRHQGKNAFEVLQMTIDDAYDFFFQNPLLRKKLGVLKDVGLGYLQVGQSGSTLSGGESQRLKIAHALDQSEKKKLLYIFDEPTTGLHLQDIENLMRILQKLVDQGNSVLVIEHHLDLIANSDWLIDLGPTGGIDGGYLLAEGTPAQIMKNPKSVTGIELVKAGYAKPVRATNINPTLNT